MTNELYSFHTSWLCVYQKSQTNIDSFKLFFIFWDYRIIISFYLPFHSFKSSHITHLLTVFHIYGLFFICYYIQLTCIRIMIKNGNSNLDGVKLRRSQPYTKKYMQWKHGESERNSLCQGRTIGNLITNSHPWTHNTNDIIRVSRIRLLKSTSIIVLYFSEIGHLKLPRPTLNLWFFCWGHIPVPLGLVWPYNPEFKISTKILHNEEWFYKWTCLAGPVFLKDICLPTLVSLDDKEWIVKEFEWLLIINLCILKILI